MSKRLFIPFLAVLWSLLPLSVVAQRHYHSYTHHSYSSHHSYSTHHYSGYSAGINDISRAHDYARPVGSAHAHRLSTGWTSGHYGRTEHVRDSYRHTRSGHIVHAHGYWRHPSH